jgi:hypothetical protein
MRLRGTPRQEKYSAPVFPFRLFFRCNLLSTFHSLLFPSSRFIIIDLGVHSPLSTL